MIIIPVTLDTLSTLKDGTIKLVFETQELHPSKVGELFGYRNQIGYLAFKPELFSSDEINAIESLKVADYEGTKSPSKRMRDILYVIWKSYPDGYKDFNLYYQYRMDELNKMLKSEIPY